MPIDRLIGIFRTARCKFTVTARSQSPQWPMIKRKSSLIKTDQPEKGPANNFRISSRNTSASSPILTAFRIVIVKFQPTGSEETSDRISSRIIRLCQFRSVASLAALVDIITANFTGPWPIFTARTRRCSSLRRTPRSRIFAKTRRSLSRFLRENI